MVAVAPLRTAWAWASVHGEGIKIIQFPYALIKALGDMLKDPEWSFEGFPMPYDLTVGNTGEGGARYSLIGSPKPTPVSKEDLAELADKRSVQDIVNAILEKQGGKKEEPKAPSKGSLSGPAFQGKDYPQEEINPDEIPF